MAARRFSAAQNTRSVYVHRSGSRTYQRVPLSPGYFKRGHDYGCSGRVLLRGRCSARSLFDSSILNAGTFQSTGVAVSATQNLGSNASATVIYGDTGALTADKPSW